MALAVYGKHPAKGDFLEYGLPAALKPALEQWLDSVLAEAKASLGADWQAIWPAAPMLRFWVGESIWGAPVAGVMASAQDRVGRRFPLVLLALGEAGLSMPPPVTDPDQSWYDAACAHLGAQLQRDDLSGPADLVRDAPQPALSDALPGPSDFWAARPGADVAGLLADIALTDHRRANAGRSYWWVAGPPEVVADSDGLTDPILPKTDDVSLPPTDTKAAEPAEGVGSGDQKTDPDLDDAAKAGTDGDTNLWDLPDMPETDASPFAVEEGGLSLFAPPEAGGLTDEEIYVAPQTQPVVAAKPLWSQVWAGPGLPSGAVLAWFFRGHAGND